MKTLLPLLFCLFTFSTIAQNCSIDFSQNQVGIYPEILQNATVGQSYSQDITFVLPTDTMGYDFTNFQIVSVSLPVGLNWLCNNNANNCNYNPQLSPFGCVHIYGTPLLAGVYNIDVLVLADLTILSGYPISFQIELTIAPSNNMSTNSGFTVQNNGACAPAIISFSNNNPGLAYYVWDFGNGNTSNAANPTAQYYENPGSYYISYTAYTDLDTTSFYSLNEFQINNLSNFGGGFPAFENADAYFKILENGQLIYQSGIIGDLNPPVQWSVNLNFNPNHTYVIEIWEADASYAEPYLGTDDFMGSQNLNWNGCNSCSFGNATITYQLNQQLILPTPSIVTIDTIEIYANPQAPPLFYDATNQELSTPDIGLNYQWFFNGVAISGATQANWEIQQSGSYFLYAINGNGCHAASDTLMVTFNNPEVGNTLEFNLGRPQIYPNPNSGTFQIRQTNEVVSLQFTLYDMNGSVIQSGIFNEQNQTISILTSAPGIYLLQLHDGARTFYYRIMKNS